MTPQQGPPGWWCGRNELISLFISEAVQDVDSVTADGRAWKQVYSGARLLAGMVRLPAAGFLLLRLLLTGATAALFALEVKDDSFDQWWLLTFEHWTMVLQLLYFILISIVTLVAVVITSPTAAPARSTPILVRLAELAYGALLPAVVVNFGVSLIVHYFHRDTCLSAADVDAHPRDGAIHSGVNLAIVVLDASFSRQPYYATFHAASGILFCWGWLLFAAVWEAAGGRNEYGQSYILRCLDWSYPILGGGRNADGKLLVLNFFLFVPVVNYAYWSLLWARRRATGQPPSRAAPLALERTPGFTHQRKVLQYSADWRDMELDGKHWRAQFGGSNGRAPRTGAYVFFSATTYAPVRLLLALGAVALFTVRIVDYNRRLDDDGSEHTAADGAKALLYFGTWLQAVACLYFALAAALTSFAVYSPGAEAERAPFLVWVAWMLHGMVLPASLVNALFWPFVAEGYELTARGLGFAYTYVTLAMVLFDLYINRQPYYAAYHGLVGLVFVYVYLLFNAIYVTAGGTDALGHDYIYKAFASPDTETSAQAFFSAGKVAFFELFLVVPFLNVLFWCMLWARRRARVSASAKMGSP